MLHRADRLVVVMLFALGILLSGMPGSRLVSPAQANDDPLRFDEIDTRARANGLRAQIIAQRIAAAAAERDRALQWSNPVLAYDREESGDFREWQFRLHKRFEAPFAQSRLRDGWDGRVRAAELRGSQEAALFLTELRAGYVRLRLLESHSDRLAELAELVDLATEVAGSRHAEGVLSGVDRQLIQLAAYSIDADSRRVLQEQRRQASSWRAEMGLPADVAVELVTHVSFLPFELADAADYAAVLSQRPSTLAQTTLGKALGSQAAAARPGLVPGIDVFGGFKRFETGLDGVVAGVALDLPFFGRRAGSARQLEAEKLIVESQLAIDLARTREEITALVGAIRAAQPSLAEFAASLDRRPSLTGTLLSAYREGSLDLSTLVNAIQLESAALEDHHEELVAYYLNIFRLEAITGLTIVHFAP